MPAPLSLVALFAPMLALIAITPDPIAFHLGPLSVYWYGVCYAVGLAAAYAVITREARRRGLNARLVDNGIIIVAVAALVGGRLYHVIDQWQLYKDNLVGIVLPPYNGLGVYGGILTGTIALVIVTRRWHQSFWRWADVIAPALFVMQAIGRWGNFFNQELYGPPTDLPWGIAIDCVHRIAPYPCTTYPLLTTGFQPLFLYESLSGVLGAITLLWIARRYGPRMRPGDLVLIFFIWYAVVRFALETLRSGNWTFFGAPTAMLISGGLIAGSLIVLAIRNRPGVADGDRWGDAPEPGWEGAEDDEDEWVDDDEDEVASVEGAPVPAEPADPLPSGGDDVDTVEDEEPDGDDTPGESVDNGSGPGEHTARPG
ncbi:MAG TPA: prolipoprotein diacylglyceryl transferase [Candidatus Limnocylindrales bacterium]